MRAVVQRVSSAEVRVDGAVVGAVDRGLLVFVCAMEGDTVADVDWLVDKLSKLRVFPNEQGQLDLTVEQVGGGFLVVSQFTLSAELSPGLSKGNRPAFTKAMAPGPAEALVDAVAAGLVAQGGRVSCGVFGASMAVSLVNDGPVTLSFDSRPRGAHG